MHYVSPLSLSLGILLTHSPSKKSAPMTRVLQFARLIEIKGEA